MNTISYKCRRCGQPVLEGSEGKRCGCSVSPSPWVPAQTQPQEYMFRAYDLLHGKMLDWEWIQNSSLGLGIFECQTLMSYIGVKDKNQHPIYTGDIVKFVFETSEHSTEEVIGEVFFQEGVYYFDRYYMFAMNDNNLKKHTLEVIGNIYQHLELLK